MQVGRMGSAMELSSIPRFVPEPYGLEDDQRSMGFDEPDYGLGHPVHYSTVPRNPHAYAHVPPRRAGCVFLLLLNCWTALGPCLDCPPNSTLPEF